MYQPPRQRALPSVSWSSAREAQDASPKSARRTFPAVTSETRRFDSSVMPAMCGVSSRFGVPSKRAPASALSGSSSKTSIAAPPSRPVRSASTSAASSTIPPREVLTSRACVDQPARRVRERDVDAHRVAHAQQIGDRLDALGQLPGGIIWGEVGVARGDPHIEGARALGDRPGDRPEADQAEPRAGQLVPAEFLPRPLAGRDARRRSVDGAPQRQHRRQHVLRHRDGVRARGREDRDAALGAGVDVDVVEAHAEPSDDLEGGRGVEQLAIDAGDVAHDQRSHARDRGQQFVARLGESGLVLHGAIAPQRRDGFLVHEFAD